MHLVLAQGRISLQESVWSHSDICALQGLYECDFSSAWDSGDELTSRIVSAVSDVPVTDNVLSHPLN